MNNLDVQNMELEKGKVYLIKYEIANGISEFLINTLVCKVLQNEKFLFMEKGSGGTII